MALKLKFANGSKIDFADKKRWSSDDGKVFKLLNPDREADKMVAEAQIVSVKELKADSKLVIAGVANANIVDRSRERINPTGLIVADFVKNPVLLAHHSYYHPIGQVTELDIRDDGVHFTAWIGDPGAGPMTLMQAEIRSLVAQRVLRTVSVGFIPKKIRSPVYNDQGLLVEPLVIESWDLLELSIVAVPCNQDSVFDLKTFEGDVKAVKSAAPQVSLPSASAGQVAPTTGDQNMIVKTVAAEGGAETPATPAATPEGAAGAAKGEAEDNAGDNFQGEVLTLLRSQAEVCKRLADVCDVISTKLEEKPAAPKDEEAGKSAEGAATAEVPASEAAAATPAVTPQTADPAPAAEPTPTTAADAGTTQLAARVDQIEKDLNGIAKVLAKIHAAVIKTAA